MAVDRLEERRGNARLSSIYRINTQNIYLHFGSNHRTFATDIELFHIGWFLDNMLDTSNRIEGFNAKIKATRKKIFLNSEDNSLIVLTNCCESYSKSLDSGLITI